MLSGELLVARVRGEMISPVFMNVDEERLELVRDIITVFKDHTGKKLGEMNGILEELEDQGFDYKLIRGLVSLLDRRCTFQVDAKVEPAIARRAAFEASAKVYPVTDYDKRHSLLEGVASSLEISLMELEQALYADLEDELLIESFRPPAPEELIQQYNLGLAQTMLFKATQLRFRSASGHKEALRKAKWLGLMYDAAYNEGRLDVTVDGPASTLKMSERYGTAMAKLLPAILYMPGWSIEATILRKDFSGNPKLYVFAMNEDKHGSLFGNTASEPSIEFDSAPEKTFYNSFSNAGTGWSISREPEPLIAGRSIFIPDFLLEKNSMKVYVEIAGFWTSEYLKRKVAKLKEIKDRHLIVLASDQLACEAFREIPDVLFFGRKMPLRQVLNRLKTLESSEALAGADRLKETGLELKEDIIRISDLASDVGESIDAIKAFLEINPPVGYLVTNEELISEVIIGGLRRTLPSRMPYTEAVKSIGQEGITSVDAIIQALGYTVKWSGLDPDGAIIYRAK
ncbi:MAG TPA: DUF790 family protein [Methanocella sp.]|nr:DUF790 family protein [Methanocella sp.]